MNKMMIASIVGASAAIVVGCSDVTELTKERVARSETAIQQAQQTVGNSEAGALELQRAKEYLDSARKSLSDGEGVAAERFASQAQLTSELATSKAQSASARRAADELRASIDTLRQEISRGTTIPTTGTP